MFDVVLLMAGSGKRTELEFNKVFFQVNNKPLFLYSLEKFESIKECNKIVLVVNENDFDKVKQLETNKILITIGGINRQDSVYNGLLKCNEDHVLIHDCARPNTSIDDIMLVAKETIKNGCAVLSHKVVDTIKEINNGKIIKTLNRNNLIASETPQGVTRLQMINCLEQAKKTNYIATDDFELLEVFLGIKGNYIESSNLNIKVTNKKDLELIKIIMENDNV